MAAILEALSGKKTYFISFLVVAIALTEGVLGWDVPGVQVGADWITWMLSGLGLGTLRAAVAKS